MTVSHVEKHFSATETVRDVVIGMSDGLTVPFALAAGLSGAAIGTHIIVTAGLAEVAAGAIAMGLGGYLAAKTDREHYFSERRREEHEVEEKPEHEAQEVSEVFEAYGMTQEQIAPIIEAMQKNPTKWVDFMMKFELGLDEPDPARAAKSAATIGVSYIVGGLIPLAPYFVINRVHDALLLSIGVTLAALFLFGVVKGKLTGIHPFKGGLQTALIGGAAAAAAFGIASWVGQG